MVGGPLGVLFLNLSLALSVLVVRAQRVLELKRLITILEADSDEGVSVWSRRINDSHHEISR